MDTWSFFQAPQQLAQCISVKGDWEYELITGVEWTNQNTINAIFRVENLINISVIKTRNILRKIVNAGVAEICLYLCSDIPDTTHHKSINVSKRIKTLEVSETFDPLWSLLRGTQHLSESASMICRLQDILNFIVSILSIGLFSQSMSDRSNLILHLAILWFSFFFHGVFMHPLSF